MKRPFITHEKLKEYLMKSGINMRPLRYTKIGNNYAETMIFLC